MEVIKDILYGTWFICLMSQSFQHEILFYTFAFPKKTHKFFAQFSTTLSRVVSTKGECKCCKYISMKVKFAQGITKIFISKAPLSLSLSLLPSFFYPKIGKWDRHFTQYSQASKFVCKISLFPFGFSVSMWTSKSTPFCSYLRRLTWIVALMFRIHKETEFHHCNTLHLCLICPKKIYGIYNKISFLFE